MHGVPVCVCVWGVCICPGGLATLPPVQGWGWGMVYLEEVLATVSSRDLMALGRVKALQGSS